MKTRVYMKNIIFWDVTLCIRVEVRHRFGGTNCLHLHDLRVS
jgi:hypothetical protein